MELETLPPLILPHRMKLELVENGKYSGMDLSMGIELDWVLLYL
jgi:hypothetical protein